MTTTRRDFVIGTGATLAAANLNATADTATARRGRRACSRQFTEELLVDYPESATMLGIDNERARGAEVEARGSFGGRAGSHREAGREAACERLKSIDTRALGDAARIDVDVMRTAHEFALEGFAFPYGDVALLNSQWSWRNAPYVVAQNTGAFLEIPGMLDEQHTIETPRGCRRLSSAARGLRGPARWRNRRGCAAPRRKT